MSGLATNPAILYFGCATLMFCSYYSAEMARGKTSSAGTRFVTSSWSSISVIVTSIIFAIYTSYEVGVADTQAMAIAVILCVVTLSISSSILRSAWS